MNFSPFGNFQLIKDEIVHYRVSRYDLLGWCQLRRYLEIYECLF